MSARRWELACWTFAVLAAAAATLAWRGAVPSVRAEPAALATPAAYPTPGRADSLLRLADRIASGDPFRLERRPSNVAYRPELEGVPQPPPVPRPPLRLTGIMGGPPWQGVLEGVPGREGAAVVRAGDTLGVLRVRLVNRDTVIVQGMDTTWKLTVKRP
jgi:hypothetical protein